jgi:mannose-1-phosphate guanylyltransferase
MKAVILAGGKGTRVRPITETIPKPMIPIVNRPLMEFLIDLLRQQGFDQIVISTAYLANEIENYFRDGSRFGVQLAYSFEGHYRNGEVVADGLGAAGGLKKIQDHSGFFDETFAVVCGDALIDLDFGPALAFHRHRGSLATLLLREVSAEETSKYGVVRTDTDGRILQFQEKPSAETAISTTINTGVYLFEPEVLDYIPSGQPFDIACEFFPLLVDRGVPFYGTTLPFSWIDIGRTTDYWLATQMVLRGDVKFADMPGMELAPGIWGGINLNVNLARCDIRGPVFIGSSTRIADGATIIGPSVIGRNCLVEGGAYIDRCIVGDYTSVSGLADLSEKIISGRFCVDRHGNNVDLVNTGYAFVIDDIRERRQWTEDQQSLIEFLRAQTAAHLPMLASFAMGAPWQAS